jgi:hypothetical protein
MPQAAADSALVDVLARLETALLSPPVAGELQSWSGESCAAMDALAEQLPQFLEQVLHRQYLEIAGSDPELLPKIEQMIAEDRRLVEDLGGLRRRLAAFAQSAALIKKNEVKVAEERQRLEEDGIALIIRIKKQRAAADTWLAEALYRDRGSVD